MTEATDVPVLDFLLEPLGYDFMQRAFLITITAAIVCGVLSCWLVLIGWSLMGDAVSHAVLPGVVLAYLLGTPFALGALVFGLGAVALIFLIRSTSRVKEDAAIGVVFTTLFALGLVLISVVPSQTDLGHILFGNLLGVSVADLVQVLVLGAVTLAILVLKRRDLTLYAFDPTHAHAIGLNPRALGALLLGLLALTVVVALQAVGVVLVVAMVIIPGATAYLLTDRFARMLVIAPSIAAACAIIGIYASYYLDAASGGMVVLTMGVAFALAYLFAPKHGIIGRRVAAARRSAAAPTDARPAEQASAR
ncbi:MAG TPA: metal ABC transporter permease [Agromyces sp.]|nr:metal ABC transporter permease [Agromyces sp.]